jgi:hypothetical protein
MLANLKNRYTEIWANYITLPPSLGLSLNFRIWGKIHERAEVQVQDLLPGAPSGGQMNNNSPDSPEN